MTSPATTTAPAMPAEPLRSTSRLRAACVTLVGGIVALGFLGSAVSAYLGEYDDITMTTSPPDENRALGHAILAVAAIVATALLARRWTVGVKRRAWTIAGATVVVFALFYGVMLLAVEGGIG